MSSAAAATASGQSFSETRGNEDNTTTSCSAPSKTAGGTRKDGSVKIKGFKAIIPAVKINLREPDLSKCYVCDTKFNIFNHRHVCRSCHEPVCNSCARSRKVLQAQTKPKRVCDLCINKFWSKKDFDGETRKSDDCAPSLTLPAADADSCHGIASATSQNNSAVAASFIGIGEVGMTSARTLPPPTPVAGDDYAPTPPASTGMGAQAGRGGSFFGSFFGGRLEGGKTAGNKEPREREGSVSSSRRSDVVAVAGAVVTEEKPLSLPSLPSAMHQKEGTASSTASSTPPTVAKKDGNNVDDVMRATEAESLLSSPKDGMGQDVATASSISAATDNDGLGEPRDDGSRLDSTVASITDALIATVEEGAADVSQALQNNHDKVNGVSMSAELEQVISPASVDEIGVDTATASCTSAAGSDASHADQIHHGGRNVEGIVRATEEEILLSSPKDGMEPVVSTTSSASVATDNDGRDESTDDGSRLDSTVASTTDATLAVTAPIATVEEGAAGVSIVDEVGVDVAAASCPSVSSPAPAVEDLGASYFDQIHQGDKTVDGIMRETETEDLSLVKDGMELNFSLVKDGTELNFALAPSISASTDNDGREESGDDGSRLYSTVVSSDASLAVTAPIVTIDEDAADVLRELQNNHEDVDGVPLPASPEAPLPVLADEADAAAATCASATAPAPTVESSNVLSQGNKVDDALLAEEAEVLLPAHENDVGLDSAAALRTSAETAAESAKAILSPQNSQENTVGGAQLPEQDRIDNAAAGIREVGKGGASRVACHGKKNARVACVCFATWVGFCLVAVFMVLAVVILLARGRE